MEMIVSEFEDILYYSYLAGSTNLEALLNANENAKLVSFHEDYGEKLGSMNGGCIP